MTRSGLSSSITTRRVWPEVTQRRSAVSTVSAASTVTTAGIGVITSRASCSCRWKTPPSIPASPGSRRPRWAPRTIISRSSSAEATSSSASASIRSTRVTRNLAGTLVRMISGWKRRRKASSGGAIPISRPSARAIASLIEPLFEGVLGEATSYILAFLFAYAVVTLLHVIFGEQAPKMIGIARAEGLLIGIAPPLEAFRRLFHPLIILTNVPARFLVTRVLRIDAEADEEVASAEELRLMIVRGAQRGRLDPGEAGMLGGVFHLHEQEAREVMTPIPAVVTIDAAETVETALRRCVTSGHTRLVVIEEDNPDRVMGIVHNNSLARLYMSDGPEAQIEPVVRDAVIVPETRPLDDLLHDLQVRRTSLAVIVDEYGRTVGIVTVEDILEEVVGEIEDETDPRAAALRQLAGGAGVGLVLDLPHNLLE